MPSPRILIVTPEISYLPEGLGNMAKQMLAKAGGLADVSATLVTSLYELGADVHVAIPNYRKLFQLDVNHLISSELRLYHSKLPSNHIHLAEDRLFYYQDDVYSSDEQDNTKSALVFQREVINNIIPFVRPDIIHCHDWMTGLIPAYARRLGIPSLFTLHNIHTDKLLLEAIEEAGIDTAEFWQYLYYQNMPANYEQTRSSIPVDLLASAIHSASRINSVSTSFLDEIINGEHPFIPAHIRQEICIRHDQSSSSGIINAPDPSYNPENDPSLVRNYTPASLEEGKRINKQAFQQRMGLPEVADAPLFFWPSRLDPLQKGPELLSDILAHLVSKYQQDGIQFAFVADGEHQKHLREVVSLSQLEGSVVIHNFDESLSRLGFAASDFILMPSLFEPCGLTQMIAMKYGCLPIVRDTGGLKDTVSHLDPHLYSGNGFVFEDYDSAGLEWAIDQAMNFYHLSHTMKQPILTRVMRDSLGQFTHKHTAQQYIKLYEKLLDRPL